MADIKILNIIGAVIGLSIVILIFGIGGFYFAKFFNKIFKKIKFFIKYILLKKEIPTNIENMCIEAFEKKEDINNFKISLLLKGINEKEMDEYIYIYKKLIKEMKGGELNNGRKYKKSNKKDKKTKKSVG